LSVRTTARLSGSKLKPCIAAERPRAEPLKPCVTAAGELPWERCGTAGRIDQVKLRWLQGRIELGLGNLAIAEEALREAHQGLEKEELGYHAALSSLDLAGILLRRGCEEEARTVVLQATEVFLSLDIEVEAIRAVLVLQRVFESGVQGWSLLDDATRFLRRIEYDPSLTFSAWFL